MTTYTTKLEVSYDRYDESAGTPIPELSSSETDTSDLSQQSLGIGDMWAVVCDAAKVTKGYGIYQFQVTLRLRNNKTWGPKEYNWKTLTGEAEGVKWTHRFEDGVWRSTEFKSTKDVVTVCYRLGVKAADGSTYSWSAPAHPALVKRP